MFDVRHIRRKLLVIYETVLSHPTELNVYNHYRCFDEFSDEKQSYLKTCIKANLFPRNSSLQNIQIP